MNVSTDAPPKPILKSVIVIHMYTHFHQNSSRMSVGHRNLKCRPATSKTRMVVASITTANVVPPVLTPKIVNKVYAVGNTGPSGGGRCC